MSGRDYFLIGSFVFCQLLISLFHSVVFFTIQAITVLPFCLDFDTGFLLRFFSFFFGGGGTKHIVMEISFHSYFSIALDQMGKILFNAMLVLVYITFLSLIQARFKLSNPENLGSHFWYIVRFLYSATLFHEELCKRKGPSWFILAK